MNPLLDVAVIGALLGAEFLLSAQLRSRAWVRPPRLP
jgi:hypothetical protein